MKSRAIYALVHRVGIVLGISWCTFMKVYSVELTIDRPGEYTLGGDIELATAVADTVIVIAENNVTLDLDTHTIRQLGTTAGVNGIVINQGLSNITIKNGNIQDFQGSGILINQNCRNIFIQNIQFSGCVTGLNATAALNLDIVNGYISGCVFNNCTTSITVTRWNNIELIDIDIVNSSAPCLLSTCTVVSLENMSIFSCTIPDAGRALNLDTCVDVTVSDVGVSLCRSSGGFVAVDASSGSNINFKECFVSQCSAQTTFTGFLVRGTNASGCFFDTCNVVTSSAGDFIVGFSFFSYNGAHITNCSVNGCAAFVLTSGALTGFELVSLLGFNAQNCDVSFNDIFRVIGYDVRAANGIIHNCSFVLNGNNTFSGGTTGFRFQFITGPGGIQVSSCSAIRNSGRPFSGFSMNQAAKIYFKECVANDNNVAGRATGFLFANTTDVYCESCVANGNNTNDIATCAGFEVTSASGRLTFDRCVSSFNRSAGSSSAGLVFFINESISNCSAQNCVFQNNVGQTDALSFGVFQGVGTSLILLTNNRAFANGNVLGNQFFGVAGTSQNVGATTATVNSITQPWTNVAIVS